MSLACTDGCCRWNQSTASHLALPRTAPSPPFPPQIKFNGGGHINHALFFANLCPAAQSSSPSGSLSSLINESFGSFDACKAEMTAKGIGVMGSGWVWLGYNKSSKLLEVATCPNQDPLGPTTGLVPIIGIDVWEHAYYLDYKNVRPAYLEAIWNVINWEEGGKRLEEALK